MKLIQEIVNQADLQVADGSDAGSTDVKNKGAEVKFDLMRNTINSDGKVKGSDVADYLERAHELNDEVEAVLYGLETSDGKVVKVYVNATQADAFEGEMKKMLGMEDDIEDAINNLAAKFDIVDVIWPKGEGPDGEAAQPSEDEVSLDDAADIGDPSLDDEDDDMETIAAVDDEVADATPPADEEPPEEDLPSPEEDDEGDQPTPEKKKKKSGGGEGEAQGDDEVEGDEEQPPKKDKKKGDKHSLLKQIGGGLAGKEKVSEGRLLWASDDAKKAFKVEYFDPKYGEMRTATIKAKDKQAAEDFCAGKGYDLRKIELVAEGEVVKADFSKGKGVESSGIEIPKGYDRFEVDDKKIIGIKGDKKTVVSATSDERLAQELVRIYNGGKASTTIKPMSLLQAFGSRDIAAADEAGIKLTEKPSYWEDFEGDGFAAKNNIDQLKLKRLEKTVGKLKEYSGKDIYGTDVKPRGPLKTVVKMPPEDMFIVRFSDGSRYVADQTGARTYIRMWQKIN